MKTMGNMETMKTMGNMENKMMKSMMFFKDNSNLRKQDTCLSNQEECQYKAQCCSGLDCLPTRGFSFTCQDNVEDGDHGDDGDKYDDVDQDDDVDQEDVRDNNEAPAEHCQGVWEECLGDRECCNDLKCVDFTCL